MRELDPRNVIGWLRERGHLPAESPAQAELLSGGVSNVVLRINTADGSGFIIKQSRERLRTEAAWFSRLDRIWREADVMRDLEPLVPAGFVPRVLFEDRENYVFAMQAAPDTHIVWKSELLAGRFDAGIARRLGAVTRGIHQATSGPASASFRQKYCDREVFDQLRIDPFYRRVAERHSDLTSRIDELIERTLVTPVCLVHGDLSPKNLLVTRTTQTNTPAASFAEAPPELMLVDYEVAHYGDPAFDIGFLLSHLLLKAVYHAGRRREVVELAGDFWRAYAAPAPADAPYENAGAGRSRRGAAPAPAVTGDLEQRSIQHLAACMLARIDGTSRIDYLPEAARQDFVRRFARRLLLEPVLQLDDVFARLATDHWPLTTDH